jgi:hypothetical protein
MKRSLILSLLIFATCCCIAATIGIQSKVLNYGIFRFSPKEEVISSPETPSGITRIPAGAPILVSATNQIPARIGIRFGMTYEINKLPVPDGEAEITKIAKHPPITKPDGTTSTGFTFVEKQLVKNGPIVGWTGYGFDHDYELVTGRWEFEMKFDNKTLCKQEFIVFKG